MSARTKRSPHHVVIVGGGFAGVACVKGLAGAGAQITLVDRHNHHLFQPLLYQVATSVLPATEIAWPLREMFRDRADVTTLLGDVNGVDPDGSVVHLATGQRLRYDTLVLATGARHSYFGKEHWEVSAPGLKTLSDATTIRAQVLSAFEAAERTDDPTERSACLTFVIVGGGPTGVELAGAIAELAHRVMPREFRRIDTHSARVLLIEAGSRILGAFAESQSRYAKRALERLGVEVRTETRVSEIGAQSILAGGSQFAARTILWAAGVQASSAAAWVGAPMDRLGRAIVQPDLTVRGRPEILILGDAAAVTTPSGTPVPGIAPAAKQMGAHAARTIADRLRGQKAKRVFRYRNMGNLATIGHRSAVVDLGWITFRGALAWWIWSLVHVHFLISTRSRISVSLTWLWSHMMHRRSARLIISSANGPFWRQSPVRPEVHQNSKGLLE